MLYKPVDERLWDTWIFPHDGTYYLFYIRISKGGSRWDGVSLATSTDLLHWREVGPVLEKADDALWLGTGMVVDVNGRFILNFSEERPEGHQVIGFAQSDDLIHWERLGREHDLRPDGVHYQNDPTRTGERLPRWDSIGVAKNEGPGPRFVGFVCASDCRGEPGAEGTLGLLTSDDAVHWTQKPPPVPPGLFPNYEVAEHVAFEDRHYVLFSTNSDAGVRFDPRTAERSGGTYYVYGKSQTGPYGMPPGDPLLQGHRGTGNVFAAYVGRPLATFDGDLLFYHHRSSYHDQPNAWSGPPKRLVERREGELGLDYWEGTETLKGELLAEGVSPGAIAPQSVTPLPVVRWEVNRDLEAEATGAHVAMWEAARQGEGEAKLPTDLRDGRILEMELDLRSGYAAGVWLGRKAREDGTGIVFNAAFGRLEFGRMWQSHGSSMSFNVEEAVSCTLASDRPGRVRILARGEFVEVYLDDRLIHSYVQRHAFDPYSLGFYAERAHVRFGNIRVWEMR